LAYAIYRANIKLVAEKGIGEICTNCKGWILPGASPSPTASPLICQRRIGGYSRNHHAGLGCALNDSRVPVSWTKGEKPICENSSSTFAVDDPLAVGVAVLIFTILYLPGDPAV
jgi:hypothetical protein